MAWLAVGAEIILFALLNLELVSAATYSFQIPSLISSIILLQDSLSSGEGELSPLVLLEIAWLGVAIVCFSRLLIRSIRKA